jgi:outer membrane immunogenic protein
LVKIRKRVVLQWLAAPVFLLLFIRAAAAQEIPRFEIAGDYTLVRSNAPPGGCGCFFMNGGSAAGTINVLPGLGITGDVTVVHAGNVNASGQPLTLTSYLFGPRFTPIRRRIVPFAEALFGGVHASGLQYGSASQPANALAFDVGGGADFSVTSHFSVRLIEADYYMTRLTNGMNARENNLRLSFGVVFGFGRH